MCYWRDNNKTGCRWFIRMCFFYEYLGGVTLEVVPYHAVDSGNRQNLKAAVMTSSEVSSFHLITMKNQTSKSRTASITHKKPPWMRVNIRRSDPNKFHLSFYCDSFADCTRQRENFVPVHLFDVCRIMRQSKNDLKRPFRPDSFRQKSFTGVYCIRSTSPSASNGRL